MSKKSVMVITGTRTGIGYNLAKHYSGNGFHVIGCSRSQMSDDLKNYEHYCLDVSDETEVLKMFSEIKDNHHQIDVLINNAGITSVNYVLLSPLKTMKEVNDTNILGTFLFCREAVKIMKKRKFGRIVNLSSIHVPLATVGSSAYSASKAAVEQLSRVLSREVVTYGITVNNLALSYVKQSGMVKKVSEEAITKILEHTITKSQLDYADLYNAIDFLILPASRMITGQTLTLGGI